MLYISTWIYPGHCRNQWRDLVIAVMKLRILWMGNFMSSWTIVCFSGNNPTHGISYLTVNLVQNCTDIVNWIKLTRIVNKHGISKNLTKRSQWNMFNKTGNIIFCFRAWIQKKKKSLFVLFTISKCEHPWVVVNYRHCWQDHELFVRDVSIIAARSRKHGLEYQRLICFCSRCLQELSCDGFLLAN